MNKHQMIEKIKALGIYKDAVKCAEDSDFEGLTFIANMAQGKPGDAPRDWIVIANLGCELLKKFTPGPWTVEGREIKGPQDSGVCVARIPEWGILADVPDQGPANARLIAAAPDLLEALGSLVAICENEGFPHLGNILPKARAAIAKASE